MMSKDCDGTWHPVENKPKSKVVTLHFFSINLKGALCNQYKNASNNLLPNKVYTKCPRCQSILCNLKMDALQGLRQTPLRWVTKKISWLNFTRTLPRHTTPRELWKPKPKRHSEEAKLKISLSHIGEKNPNWAGDKPKNPFKTGHNRAKRLFGNIKGLDKHHIDGNPLNNDSSNILWLTRKQHMRLDGRLKNLENGIARKAEVLKIAE